MLTDGEDNTGNNWVSRATSMLLAAGISWTVRNPLEAMAVVTILSNPTLRGTAIEIAVMLGQGAIRDNARALGIINRRITMPTLRGVASRAMFIARHPAFQATAFVVAASAVSTANQQSINSNAIALNPQLQPFITGAETDAELQQMCYESSPLFWSPFGGVGFGSVVT